MTEPQDVIYYDGGKGRKEVYSFRLGATYHDEIIVEVEDRYEQVYIGEAKDLLSISPFKLNTIHKWLKLRPGWKLHSDMLVRWGFLDKSASIFNRREDRGEWEVARVVLASGKTPGFPEPGYYASCDMRGGASSFWLVTFHTLRVFQAPVIPGGQVERDEYGDDAVVMTEGDGRLVPHVTIACSKRATAQYLDKIDSWCSMERNIDRFLTVTCPGNRRHSKIPRSVRLQEPVFCYSERGNCVRAAIGNALWSFGDAQAARAMVKADFTTVRTLGAASVQLERVTRVFCLRNVDTGKEVVQWFQRAESGVYLLRLEGKREDHSVVDHVVVFDAAKQTVWDSASKFGIKFHGEIWGLCVGDDAVFERVRECKLLSKQPQRSEGKRHRKTHKMSADKKRQKRAEKRLRDAQEKSK